MMRALSAHPLDSRYIWPKQLRVDDMFWRNSVWARTTKRGVSLPVSGQRLIVFFGKLIMSRTQVQGWCMGSKGHDRGGHL